MSVKILLADDHDIVCEGITSLLENEPDMEIIGRAKSGIEALRLVEELSPDIVIMDITMPDMNGVEATRQIISRYDDTRVIALSMHSEKRFVANMFCAGAMGYLMKQSTIKNLVQAIRTVTSNRMYLEPELTDIVVEDYVHRLSDEKTSPFSHLTAREREVLQFVSEGKSTKQIASSLFVSVKTVEMHRKHITDKLNIHSVAELTKFAIREGLTSLEC